MGAPPLSDEEVLALKQRYRAGMYRVAAVIALGGLFAILLVASLQATFLRGPRSVFLWGPAAVEALALVGCLARRRLALVAVCAMFMAAHIFLIPKAARLVDEGREKRTASPR